MSPTKTETQILLCENYDTLCDTAAQTLLTLADKAIAERKRFTLALSGGATPKGMYLLMGGSTYADLFPWSAMHFFWGDERWVPPDHPKSNYRMVAEALLTRVDVPVENIHPVKVREKDPETAAALYEKELQQSLGHKSGEFPRFDVVLLGMGQDGHVASLFPGSPQLNENKRWVAPVPAEHAVEERVTLTLPILNEARTVLFLVSGTEKANALHAVLEGSPEGPDLPASKINLRKGSLIWIVDRAAASLLTIKRISTWR